MQLPLVLLTGAVTAAVVAALAATGEWYILLGVGAAIGMLGLLARYPRVHFALFFAAVPYFFRASDVEVSIADVAFAVYFATFLLLWFGWKVLVRRQSLVWERKEWVLLVVVAATVVQGLLHVAVGHDFLRWAREWALVGLVLYYFVFRDTFATRREYEYYLALLVLMCVGLGVWAVIDFRTQVLQILYAYQIKGVRGVNAAYLIGLFLSISFYLYRDRWRERVVWLLAAAAIVTGIAATYTRTIWITALLMLLVMIVLLPLRQRVRLLSVLTVTIASAGIAGLLLLPQAFPVVLKAISYRFASATKGTADRSLVEREDETAHLLRMLQYPSVAIAGYAPGRDFIYYNTNRGTSVRGIFIHNGVLSLLVKLGIPLGLCLYAVHWAMVVKSVRCYWRSRRTSYEVYVLPFTITLFAATVVDLTTNAFFLRSGGLFLAMLYAGVMIVDRLMRQEEAATALQNV